MLEMIDAFLLASGVSYIVVALLPNPTFVKAEKLKTQKRYERILFLILAGLIIGNLIMNLAIIWALLGLLYVVAALASYLGYVEWISMIPHDGYSMQIAMWAWDLMIAVCCFAKNPFTF